MRNVAPARSQTFQYDSLNRLKDAVGTVAKTMTDAQRDYTEIAEAWVKYTSLGYDSPFIANFEWAFDAVADLIAAEPHEGLNLIKVLLDKSTNDHLIANLAAGPLETLLSRHGASVIDDIEAEARANERFRHLLGGVWRGAMSDEVWERFLKIERPTW